MRTKAILIFSLFISALLFAGCNADGVGIFYTVSKEVKQSGSDISVLSIRSFASIGTAMYAGAGPSIWKEKEPGSSWINITPAGKGADPTVASDSTNIYAPLYNDSNIDREKSLWMYDGSGWTAVADSPTGTTMMLLDTPENDFLVYIDGTGTYVVDEISNYGDLIGAGSSPTGISAYIFDAASDGTNYLLVGGTGTSPIVYFDGTGSFVAHSADPLLTTGIGGVVYDGTGLFYVTLKNGTLLSFDGTNWASVDTAPDNYSGETPELFDMEVVDVDGSDYLVIGADEGYYEMSLPGGTEIRRPTATIASDIDIKSSYNTFAYGHVRNFNPVEDKKFHIGTATGVWLNSYNDIKQK